MKSNYSSTTQWTVACAVFLASNATCPARATSSIVRGKHFKQSFIDTPILIKEIDHQTEEEISAEDWQESLMESDTMNSPALTSSSAPEIFAARIVSDEIAPFVFYGDEDECEVDDVIIKFPVKEEIMNACIVSDEVAPFFWNGDNE